jgi:hypothetical protein
LEKSSQVNFLLVCLYQSLTPNKKTVTELSKWSPANITEWRLRRLLDATYINIDFLLSWFAEEAIKSFPSPSDKVVYAVGDGSHKDKRSKKNPTVQKGRKSKDNPFFWGIKFVLVAFAGMYTEFLLHLESFCPKNILIIKRKTSFFVRCSLNCPFPGGLKQLLLQVIRVMEQKKT